MGVSSLEKYEGGRDYDSLKKFAKQNLKPRCSPANIDLCDDDKKKEIADFQAIPAEELNKQIEEKKAEIKTAEDTFSEEVKKLQENYENCRRTRMRQSPTSRHLTLDLCRPLRLMLRRARRSQSFKRQDVYLYAFSSVADDEF